MQDRGRFSVFGGWITKRHRTVPLSSSAGVGGYVTVSNVPNIYAQNGLGVVIGASGGPGVVAVGADYCMMIDLENDTTYDGVNLLCTAGLYPTVVEIHGEVGNSSVNGFNVFDPLIWIADWLQEGIYNEKKIRID